MPKPQYTRSRRIALQVIMGGLLALTMGMAAMVSSYRRSTYAVELSKPIRIGAFTVQVPAKWNANAMSRRGVVARVEAIEPPTELRDRTQQRRFTIFAERAPQTMTPQAYLLSQPAIGLVDSPGVFSGLGDDGGGHTEAKFVPIDIAGAQGVMFERWVRHRALLKVFPPVYEFYAAVVLPDQSAIAIRFTCNSTPPTPPTPADRALFRQVVERVKVVENPGMGSVSNFPHLLSRER